MTEQAIQSKILVYLKSKGYYARKVVTSNHSGVPDILACVKGRFIGIEVKKAGGVVSKLQTHNIDMITMSGGIAFVAYSVDDVKKQLDILLE